MVALASGAVPVHRRVDRGRLANDRTARLTSTGLLKVRYPGVFSPLNRFCVSTVTNIRCSLHTFRSQGLDWGHKDSPKIQECRDNSSPNLIGPKPLPPEVL